MRTNCLRRLTFFTSVIVCIAISTNSYGQDQTVKDMSTDAAKEIKKEKIVNISFMYFL